ncbi:MAG: hypothetical protein Q9M97_05865 [Candidatus Gracilibacteria bacterium]|nr:hypothetical protein [Candidatus Gracilibacteria bacterium]
MKKNIISKILISSILIFGILNIVIVNVRVGGIRLIIKYAEEFSCISINKEIKKYGDYKIKIDNLFTQLSKKDENIKNKYLYKNR